MILNGNCCETLFCFDDFDNTLWANFKLLSSSWGGLERGNISQETLF